VEVAGLSEAFIVSVTEEIAAEHNTCMKYWGQHAEDIEQGGKEGGGKEKKKKTDLANLKLSFLLQAKTLQRALANSPRVASRGGGALPARGGSQTRACPAAGEPHVMSTASSSIW